MTFHRIIPLIFLAAASCGGRDSYTPVPLPEAYPRVNVADSVFTPVDISGLRLDVNSTSDTASISENWLDIRYPAYGGTLHVSVNDHSSDSGINKAIANRRQRVALNLGGAPAVTDNFMSLSGDFACEMIVSPEGGVTPVQFIASDGRLLVSGTFALSRPSANTDSIAPVVKAVERDVRRMLENVSYSQ